MSRGSQHGSGPIILGCGNPDRGDDAAGPLLARRLKQFGVDAREQSGEPAALLSVFLEAGERPVILVDAVLSGLPPGAILQWDAAASPLPREQFRCSTHALGVAEAVELARALGKLPRSLQIYGIQGARFEPGAPPSPEVLRSVEELAHRILREWGWGSSG